MIEKIVYYTTYFSFLIIIEVSILLLVWNYCLHEFLGMNKMGVLPAIGFVILIKLFSPDFTSKNEDKDNNSSGEFYLN